MEAAPRLPMISFDLKVCTENTQFGPQLKQYIAAFYNEDPESYSSEIHNLESLRAAAVRPSMDINGVQLLKKYYCQLHFLKSRFPMEENQDAAVQFLWKDNQAGMNCGGSDIRFELMVIMYNIGALHSYLGATDSRSNPEGMKMACTHFQCAAWAFQTVKEKYHQFVIYISSVEIIHFFQQVSLAQAQECILEKSMLDNRKATIIAKVAVQVYGYYRQSLSILQSTNDELVGSKTYKEWIKYLQFKVTYHKCIALLFQGQQAEEQQKMGERVAFYQAACEQLEEARKISSGLKHWQQEINESLAFTSDVVEGKRKAAKNENEFIYHEEVPDKDHLQEVKGASLVKGIAFSVNDVEVSGPDIFARLVPMEAHEAASLYSETKAQMLRQMGELVDNKDQALAEFMSSMQLDLLTKMGQATGIPQELIDRAAALSAKPTATQDLTEAMGKLSNIYHEVESNLNEIDALLKEEEESEKRYQELMGKRPPSIIATDLAREAAKYREAHTKANDSNQTLHRAMTAHVANLKILQQPLRQLQHQLPSIELPNPNIDEKSLKDLEALVSKVEEMRNQRAMLWAQFREAVHKDDITNALVTKQVNQSLEQLFQHELQKHQQLAGLIEQNCAAQDNIRKALVDSYAKAVSTRRYVQDIIQKRNSTISSLIASHDSYDDLLAKVNKGIEFYTKLDTNVSKLLQRIKSACKVQQEEREQILQKNNVPKQDDAQASAAAPAAPKLKDYLDSRKKNPVVPAYPDPNLQYQQQMNYGVNVSQAVPDTQTWPPGIRPAPLGSEVSDLPKSTTGLESTLDYPPSNTQYGYGQATPSTGGVAYPYQPLPQGPVVDQDILKRMNNLLSSIKGENTQYKTHYPYSNYIPQNYASSTTYAYSTQPYTTVTQSDFISNAYDPTKAFTTTINSYRPLSSYTVPNNSNTHMQYPDSSLGATTSSASETLTNNVYQHPNYPQQAQNVPPQAMGQASNVNTYYPTGYDPNYSASDTQNVSSSGQGQYHSLEYATSVQPNLVNYSYNSTYSSPTLNMSSVPSNDLNYTATGTAQGTVTAGSYTDPGTTFLPQQGGGSIVSNSQPSPSPYSYAGTPQPGSSNQGYPGTVTAGPNIVNPQANVQLSSSSYPYAGTPQPASSTQGYPSTALGSNVSQTNIAQYTSTFYPSSSVQNYPDTSAAGSNASNPQTNIIQPSSGSYPYAGTPQPGPGAQSYPGAIAASSYPSAGATNPQQSSSTAQNLQGYSYSTGGTTTVQPYSGGTASLGQQVNQSGSVYAADSTHSSQTTVTSRPGPNDSQQSYLTASSCPSGTYAYQNTQSYQGGTGTQHAQYYQAGVYQGYPAGAGTPQPYQTDSNTSVNSGTTGYETYPNYYGQNYATNYNYAGNVQQPVLQQGSVAVPTPASTKESNIDLLSGLDFTINQAPLIPQQKTLPKSEESEVKVVTSETKVNLPKKAATEEKPAQSTIKRLSVKILPSKPLNNNDVKHLFRQEVEKYEKYVETLTSKTLSGPTNLDIKWKEIMDKQDSEGQKKIISVARCYPMKNRFPDILPYDYSRVELYDAKDDYINASYIKDVSPYAPPFIVTQAPISSTFGDFWTMIREQQVELIFCLLNDNEIGEDVYWPKEKGHRLNVLNMVISLQSVIVKSHWVERLISVNIPEKRDSWVVMHLQFTSWPGSLFPMSPDPLISYVLELITLYQQQKCATHPVVVHCLSGIGNSGLVCLLTTAIYDVTNNANSVPDLASLTLKLTNSRKNILRDREHLKFAYEAFLAYMKQIVSQDKVKRKLNELVPKLQEEIKQSIEIVEKNNDPLSSLDPFWASKK